jgi:hypothetical protein
VRKLVHDGATGERDCVVRFSKRRQRWQTKFTATRMPLRLPRSDGSTRSAACSPIAPQRLGRKITSAFRTPQPALSRKGRGCCGEVFFSRS